MVNGRVFHEQPLAYADVGADVGSSGAAELAIAARRLQSIARAKLPGRA